MNSHLNPKITANITDFIAKAVAASAGKVNVPSNIKDQVLGGILKK